MKLNNIFPNFDNFNNKVINRLNLLFPNSEWLDEKKALISFNTLYELLNMYYGDYNIRYDAESTFLNKFTFDLADLLPDIFAKQQAFIKNQISEFLSEAKNRAVIVQNDGTQDRNQDTNTKSAMSSTPVNKVISSAEELNNVPLTSATLQNLKFVENYNLKNEQTNMNFVKDLTNQLSADYSLRLQEFMNLIKKHFVFIVKSKGKEYLSNNECQFRNGYYVSDVDYLGIENQEQIKLLNVKTETNKTDIEIINGKIDTIPSGEEIDEKLKLKADLTNPKQRIETGTLYINGRQYDPLNNKAEIYFLGRTGNSIYCDINSSNLSINPIYANYKDLEDYNIVAKQHLFQVRDEINNYQTQQDEKILKNTNDITLINNNFNNFYTKTEIDEQQNTQNIQIQNLEDKVNENEIIIDELIKIPRFYKGQVLFFDTKNDFETNIKTPLQLQENIDYEIYENNRYLMTGENGDIGGSNKITETYLPYKEWSINIDTLYATGYGTNNPRVFGGTNSSVSTQSISTNYDLQTKSGVSGVKFTPKWNYGIKNNQDFLPTFKQVFAVKFLKNIT